MKFTETIRTQHIACFETEFLDGAPLGILGGQDAFGARVQNPFGTIVQSGAHHMDGTETINAIEFPAVTAPKVGIGGEVIDIFTTTRSFPDGLFVTNVSTHQLNPIQRKMVNGGPWPLQNTNGMARIQQLCHQMGTQETGAAGD
jgi:hypothetical protein